MIYAYCYGCEERNKARIPRHGHRHPRRHPREDRREDVGVGVVECGLKAANTKQFIRCMQLSVTKR